MLLRGFEVADIIPEMKVSNVVVGTITHIEQHPNAERLRVCNIDIGAENELVYRYNARLLMCTGVRFVRYAVARSYGGTEIKPTKMRGVLSSGMFCGGAELGINDVEYEGAGADSVLILNDGTKYTNGMRIQEALGLDDVIFDIELTCAPIVMASARGCECSRSEIPRTCHQTRCRQRQCGGLCKGHRAQSQPLPALLRKGCDRFENRALTEMDAAASEAFGNPSDQQYC